MTGTQYIRLNDFDHSFHNADRETRLANPKIYEYEKIDNGYNPNNLTYAITTVYPGKINNEYYKTRGHKHRNGEDEVYYCIDGDGYVVIQSDSGFDVMQKITSGSVVYINGKKAHRLVNDGNKPLVVMSIISGTAVADYNVSFQADFMTSYNMTDPKETE